jgi:hypothetical protein
MNRKLIRPKITPLNGFGDAQAIMVTDKSGNPSKSPVRRFDGQTRSIRTIARAAK